MNEKRKKQGDRKCIIRVLEYCELPYYKYRNIAIKNLKNKKHEKFTPDYSILMWHKPYFIMEAIKIFGYDFKYLWMDFGISHITHNVPKIIEVNDKIRILETAYFKKQNVTYKEKINHYLGHQSFLIACLFGGNAKNMEWFYNKFIIQIKESLKLGYCPTDDR